MNYDGTGNYPNTEHYLRRVLVGNVADVRRRLNSVLERLDYDFIDESEVELEARRGARGWANAYASADVMDYPRTLVIKLKPLSENSTRASFIYTIKHPSLNRGEIAVLTREAETITALATIRAMDKICAVCGAESDDDSKFCRKCGTPMTGDETAIEVLRMTAEIRSGHTSVVTSSIVVAATMIITIIALIALLLEKTNGVFSLLVLGIIAGFLNLFVIGFGWKRLNNALRGKNNESKSLPHITNSRTFSDNETSALPPAPVSFSVTDNTTELFDSRERDFEFVKRDKVVTKDLEQ